MQTPHLFWPADRKLFHKRSRLRALAPALAVIAVTVVVVPLKQLGMS